MSSKMKQVTESFRKRTGWLKVLGMGFGIALISWGTPTGADTGPGDTGGRFSSRTQPAHRVAADLPNNNTNILLARGDRGGEGGRGSGGGGKGGGFGQGQGKGYGAKDGTGTGERPRDGSGYGAGSGQGTKAGLGKGSGSGSGRGNR